MPTSINDLFQTAMAPNKVEAKQASVAQTTTDKASNLLEQYVNTPISGYDLLTSSQTGRGLNTQSALEFDLSHLTPWELRQKYGEGIEAYAPLMQQGLREYSEDLNTARSGEEGAYDIAAGITTGVLNTGQAAALLTGLVSPEHGINLAEGISDLTERVQNTQSSLAKSRRRRMESMQNLSERDNAATPMSTLERIGKDAVSAVTGSLETGNVEDLLTQAAGSLLGGFGLARGVERGVRFIPGAAGARGVRTGSMVGAIAATEGGGAYAEVVDRIGSMSHEDLLKHPFYRKIFEMTGDPVEAKERTIAAAARKAGLETAAVAAITGPFVARFEADPLARRTFGNAARNVLAETTQESVMGIASPLTSNVAIQKYADEDLDITAGLGRGLGEGALAGAGTAGMVQTPGVVSQTTRDVAGAVVGGWNARVDRINKEIERDSPVSTENLNPISSEIQSNISEITETLNTAVDTLPEDQREQANAYVQKLVSLGSYTEGQFNNPFLDAIAEGSQNKLEAIQRVGKILEDKDAPEAVKTEAALGLLLISLEIEAAVESDTQKYEQLSDDSPAAQTVSSLVNLINQYTSNPEVASSIQTAIQIIRDNSVELSPVTPENVSTPEGQRNIHKAVTVAQVAPDKGNLEVNEQILYHDDQGTIELTQEQRAALEISTALLRAEKDAVSLGSQLNLSEEASRVNREITLDTQEKTSLVDHARSIYKAILTGDTEAAQTYLQELGNFAQSMSNKLAALNKHVELVNQNPGKRIDAVKYQSWNPTLKKWFEPEKGVFYNQKSAESVNQAKAILHETKLVTDVYNNMVDALGLGDRKLPEAESSVIGSVARTPAVDTGEAVVAPVVSIPEAQQRAVADNLGVSITRVRAYSQGQTSALTESQVEQVKTFLSGAQEPAQTATPAEETIDSLDQALADLSDKELTTEINKLQRKSNKIPEEINDLAALEMESARRSDTTPDAIVTQQQESEGNQESAPVTPSVSVAQAKKLSDPELNDRLNSLLEIPESDRSPVEAATLDVLDAEMNAREHQAGIDLARQEEEENQKSVVEPVQDTTTVEESETLEETPQTDTINIWHGSNENADLSNIAERPFHYKGVDYFSVEHAYQTLKSGKFDRTTYNKYRSGGVKIAGKLGTKTDSNWNLRLMKTLIKESFKQSPDALARLKKTGNTPFSHTQDKGIWKEAFPRILESVRKELMDFVPTEATPSEHEVISKPELKGTAAAFSYLVGVPEGRNVFVSSFKFPQEQRTRFVGEEAPMDSVREIIQDSQEITKTIGTRWATRLNDLVTRAWDKYLSFGSDLSKSVANRFVNELNKKRGKKSLLELWNEGKPVHKYGNALLMNIAETITTTSGKDVVALNRGLLQNGAMATLHWLLNDAGTSNYYDHQDAVKAYKGMFDDNVSQVSYAAIELLNQGVTTQEMIRELGQKIKNYWGLQDDANGFIGNQQGIPESLARMFLEDLEKRGILNLIEQRLVVDGGYVRPYRASDKDRSDIQIRDLKKWEVNTEALGKVVSEHVQGTKALLEELVLLEPEITTYVGEDSIPPASRYQLKQPLVPLTKQQQKVQERANRQIYRLDPIMVSIYGLIGKDQMVDLFGGPDTSNEKLFNNNNLLSIEGQRKSISAAYEVLENLLAEVGSVAEAEGKEVGEVAIRYKHEFASVNRLFMQGAYTPQSSKLMREVVLTTWKTVDLNNQQTNDLFHLALAQGLDISIHKQTHEQSIEQVKALLSGPLAPAVEEAKKVLNGLDTTKLLNQTDALNLEGMKDIFEAAGVPLNFLALKSVIEYAKSQVIEDPSSFTTSLYIEADGMTNGPANAMMLFSSDLPSEQWLTNMERVGLYINQPDATANEKNADKQTVDMYQAGANRFIELVKESLNGMREVDREAAENLYRMLSLFNKDFNFTSEEDLSVKRGFFKNPLMVMIYGSTEGGVAGSITANFLDEVYSRMSAALQAQAVDPSLSNAQAMFPDSKNPEGDWSNFIAYLAEATGATSVPKDLDLKSFTIDGQLFKNLSKNIKNTLVAPMYQAIRETVGEDVFTNVERMAAAVNVMSVYAARLQKKLIEAKVESYKKEDGYSPRELLRKKDLGEIERKLKAVSAFIQATHQNFFIAGQNKFDVYRNTSMGMTNDQNPVKGQVQGFAGAGVAGVAYMNQGSGDAQMVQFGYANGGVEMDKVMPAFDGMHFAFDEALMGGLTMNKAVSDSWKLNPLQDVADTFRNFLKEANLSELTQQDWEDINRPTDGLDPESLLYVLDISAKKVAAKQKVVSQVSHAVDQMAGPGATYKNQGITLESTDLEGIANELRDLMAASAEQETVPKGFRELFTREGSNPPAVQVIKPNALRKLLSGNLLNQDQKNILGDLNLGSLKDWNIFIGDQKALIDFVTSKNIDTDQILEALNSGKGGFTIPTQKFIFVLNGSAETALHEVIHAATFEKVVAHLNGTQPNEAVVRIQGMMDEFLNLTVDDYDYLVSTAMKAVSLQNTIKKARENGQEAVAINEFMAWTLSNRELIDLTKTVKLPKVLRIAKDAWKALKELVFGKKFAPSVGSDMYTNLRFNTAVIANTETNTGILSSDTPPLFHNDIEADPDLSRLDEALNSVTENSANTMEDVVNRLAESKARLTTNRLVDEVSAAYFDMTAEEIEVFKAVANALQVEQNLDRNSLREANKLYKAVMEKLTVDDFMTEDADPSERAYANAKYSLIAGSSYRNTDAYGRSTILPVFVALALTSKEFKAILERMPMPSSLKSDETGIDGLLENLGYKSLNNLDYLLTGTNKASNIQEAMNILGRTLMDQRQARNERLEIPGRFVDSVNDHVVKGFKALSNKLVPQMTTEERQARTKMEKSLDAFKAGLAVFLDEDLGTKVAEDAVAKSDTMNLYHFARDMFGDIVGRTPGNALIYDMIKQVRSTIQALRQNYRVNLPPHIKKKFSDSLTKEDWATLHRGVLKTDLSSLVLNGHSREDARLWLSDSSARRTKINELEADVNKSLHGFVWIEKAKQLAHYMNTGEAGINLQRNAEAIVDMVGTDNITDVKNAKDREAFIKSMDTLVSLYAIEGLNQADKESLSNLVSNNKGGIDYVMSYVASMLKDEKAKITEDSKYNVTKGFIPFEQKPNVSLIVDYESKHADLISRGYVEVGDFVGANKEISRGLKYYRMNASAKAAFNQGIAQTARNTVFGVDPDFGFSSQGVVKRITDPVLIKRFLYRQDERNPLIPVFGSNGKVIALEQMMEPSMRDTIADVQDMAHSIGKWKGRQQEEVLSLVVNDVLVERLYEIYKNDPNKDRYVNVLESEDPVIKDAVNNLPKGLLKKVNSTFGADGFMIQQNMLRDVIGYRDASIRDMWTGNTRVKPEVQKAIRNISVGIMGKDAYRLLVRGEEIVENLASNAKQIIAVKSVIVPAINIISNVLHLIARGVPLAKMVKDVPTKIAEIKSYHESRIEYMKLEAEYTAATQPNEKAALEARMKAIEDGHRNLSIWPLIEAGEFTAISDVDLRDMDTRITSGKWAEYFDNLVDKLPEGVNTAAKYMVVSKDTALYNGLQKTVEYGDLVAKAILYDDLVSRKGKSREEALGVITEEFVNYDRLPGRTRGKLENLGLLWFYNFKLRSVKVGLSTIRNNPVHTLFSLALPSDYGFGNAGIPVEDNFVTLGLGGNLGYSIGPGQGIRAPGLLPINNLLD